jgi:predicted transcriptional regulator
MSNQTQDKVSDEEMLRMTTDVVSAYVGNNPLPATDIPDVIKTVYGSLSTLSGPAAGRDALRPAVPVRRSVTPDYLVCLEDGKKLKMLKRHLRTNYDMTPEEYRAKWGLPPDYPMVAPNYAKQRSEFAKRIGLGRRKGGAAPNSSAAN